MKAYTKPEIYSIQLADPIAADPILINGSAYTEDYSSWSKRKGQHDNNWDEAWEEDYEE